MTTHRGNPARVKEWVSRCLPHAEVTLSSAWNLKNGRAREVWDCTFETNGGQEAGVLSIFKPGSLESVNTSLPPDQAALKCALAMAELPALGIPTPRLLGHAKDGREAAVLAERIETTAWAPPVRLRAARILAQIHCLEENRLSEALRELLRLSDPREYRTTGGQAPSGATSTLVHGDYFSSNILPVAEGLFVIDWETFGRGDPMWDLGFLIGADRGLMGGAVAAVVAAYESGAPVDRERLTWHQQRWSEYWMRRSG